MAPRYRLHASLCLLLFAAACGGSDVPTGLEEGVGGDQQDPAPVANPSFATDVNPIFALGGCSAGSCHGGGAGALTLTSSAATNYANLVDVASPSAPSYLLVEPGDPTDSYLVMKLEGRQVSGAPMPLGGNSVTANQIATIKNWIGAGAPDN